MWFDIYSRSAGGGGFTGYGDYEPTFNNSNMANSNPYKPPLTEFGNRLRASKSEPDISPVSV